MTLAQLLNIPLQLQRPLILLSPVLPTHLAHPLHIQILWPQLGEFRLDLYQFLLHLLLIPFLLQNLVLHPHLQDRILNVQNIVLVVQPEFVKLSYEFLNEQRWGRQHYIFMVPSHSPHCPIERSVDQQITVDHCEFMMHPSCVCQVVMAAFYPRRH